MTAFDDDKPAPRGELTLQVVPLPADTNANGDVFAGWLVKQMDIAAATLAGRISQGAVFLSHVSRLNGRCKRIRRT